MPIDLFAAGGDMLGASHFVWQAGETSWWWDFVQLASHLLRCGLCNAKHVGTFNHVERYSKRKKICEPPWFQGMSRF